MTTWRTVDTESGIEFIIVQTETGKLQLDCRYNNIKIDIRNYEFGPKTLESLEFLLASVMGDLTPRPAKKIIKKKKKK